jgi:hypothetical protein
MPRQRSQCIWIVWICYWGTDKAFIEVVKMLRNSKIYKKSFIILYIYIK